MLLLDDLADLVDLVVVQFTNLSVRVHTGRRQDVVRLRTSDSIDISQSNFDSFVGWKIHTCNSSHRLPLSLFMFRVHANDAHNALAMNDFAFVTNLLYGCSYFHKASLRTPYLYR